MIEQVKMYWLNVLEGGFTTSDILGWIGTFGLFAFYYLLSKGKVVKAYIFGIVAGGFWAAVGLLQSLPSLLFMEMVIILLNSRGIYLWHKREIRDKR
jgi:hypothetical protein